MILFGERSLRRALTEYVAHFHADSVVLCAGQESQRGLAEELNAIGIPCTPLGGADVAAELDAKRAIWHATEFALAFC